MSHESYSMPVLFVFGFSPCLIHSTFELQFKERLHRALYLVHVVNVNHEVEHLAFLFLCATLLNLRFDHSAELCDHCVRLQTSDC